MKIVDHRHEDQSLSRFDALPTGCTFEFPDGDGLYMKIEYRNVTIHSGSTPYQGPMNAVVLQSSTKNKELTMFIQPENKVRALQTELIITGEKKYD